MKCSVCGKREIVACGKCKKCYNREYYQRPEVKERQREYRQRPEVKERQREYYQRPEVKERHRERQRVYWKRNREKIKERQREYYQRLLQRLAEQYHLTEEEAKIVMNIRRTITRYSKEQIEKIVYTLYTEEGSRFTEMVLDGIPKRKGVEAI